MAKGQSVIETVLSQLSYILLLVVQINSKNSMVS